MLRHRASTLALMSLAVGLGASAGLRLPAMQTAGVAPRPRYLMASRQSRQFSSARQDARIARTQRTVIVNGFELMQTIPARERAPKVSPADA